MTTPPTYRHDWVRLPEPDQASEQYLVTVTDEATGEVVDTFTTDDPGRDVEAYREATEVPFAVRYAPFGPAWEREQENR